MTTYVEFPGPAEPFDELSAWGMPWHGRLFNDGSGAELTAPNNVVLTEADDIVFNYAAGCSDTHYVRNHKAPAVAPAPTDDLAAAGGSWYPDAVLFTRSKRYHPKQGDAVGQNSWIYIDPAGMRWRMSVVFGAAQTITFGGPPYFATVTCAFSVYCNGVFGDFSGIESPAQPRLLGTFNVEIYWDNPNQSHQWTQGVWAGPVEFSYDGSSAAVGGFMAYADVNGSDTLLIEIAEIALSGTGEGDDGSGITAAVTVSQYRQRVIETADSSSFDQNGYGSSTHLFDYVPYLVGWAYSKAGVLQVWERREYVFNTVTITGTFGFPLQTWNQDNTWQTTVQLRASGASRCEAFGTKTYTRDFVYDRSTSQYVSDVENTAEDGTLGAYFADPTQPVNHKLSNAVYSLQLGNYLLDRASADAIDSGNLLYFNSGGAIAAWDPRTNTIETVLGASKALAFV